MCIVFVSARNIIKGIFATIDIFFCIDNCPDTPNPLQDDDDNNGIGDLCGKEYRKILSLSNQTVFVAEETITT